MRNEGHTLVVSLDSLKAPGFPGPTAREGRTAHNSFDNKKPWGAVELVRTRMNSTATPFLPYSEHQVGFSCRA